MQIAHPEDLRAGEAWLRHLQEQTRLMVARYAPQIQEFARALAFAQVMSPEAVAALARGGDVGRG